MRERQGCRSASIQGRYGETWVINVSVGYALGARTGAPARQLYCPRSVSTVTGDGRRLPARRAPRRALPPSFGFQHTFEGE